MKKIICIFSLLMLFTIACYAIDVQTAQVASLSEANYGRSVTAGTAELITIWYTGSNRNSGYGVSSGTIVFYDSGITITATRFQGAANVNLNRGDVDKLVSIINADSSGTFKAARGRDATPGTSTAYIQTGNATLNIARNEEDAIDSGNVLVEDANLSLTLRAGFRANEQTTLRLKQFEETFEGVGRKLIKVWDDDKIIYRRAYDTEADYRSVSPLTITFTDYGNKGLSAHKNKSITVTSDWNTSIVQTNEADANLSINVGHWKE